MVVWKGFGILNVFIVALFIAFVGYLSRLVGVDTDEHNWPLSIAVLLSGIIIWFLGKYLHNRRNHIVLIDAATGEPYKMGAQHSLLFIRMEYWGPIFAVIGLAILFF